jgi:NAD(P)-dependent dehydrogenase (short-subunit alcohol dehydrogenase family)
VSLVTTPFDFYSTAEAVLAGVDLTGQRAIVTGAHRGTGEITARALAAAGAKVTLAVNDLAAGQAVAASIGARAEARPLELADQGSVRAFLADWDGPLDILVANAGLMVLPALERTAEGWEMHFGANFLGHFALMTGLRGAMAAAGGARVVVLSSTAHLRAPVFFDDPQFDFLAYDPMLAYGQSKTAGILMAVEATRRWAGVGIVANAANPGAIDQALVREGRAGPTHRKTRGEGAATPVLLAASPLAAGVGGRYFEDCNEAPVVDRRPDDGLGVARYAVDPANAERLWALAERLVT